MTAMSTLTRQVAVPSRQHRLALAAFVFMIALLMLAMNETVTDLIALWAIDDGYYSYGFLILPISLFLVWQRRHVIAGLPLRQELFAMPALVGTGGLWLIAKAADIAVLQYLTLVLSIGLIVLAVFGRHIAKRLTFPITFLLFMVPFGAPLLPKLQAITTSFADGLLWLVGIPTYRDGNLIETSFGLFNIAEECAGLQFLAANLVAGVLFAQLAFSSLRAKALLIIISIIAPILVNGLRAFGIITAVHLSGDVSIAGPDHIIYGWVLFTVSVIVTFVIGSKFADWPRPLHADERSIVPEKPWGVLFLLPLVFSILLSPTYAAFALHQPKSSLTTSEAVLDLSGLATCAMIPPADDGWILDVIYGWNEMTTAVRCQDRTADILLVQGMRYSEADHLIYQVNHWMTGSQWRIVRSGETRMAVNRLPNPVQHHDITNSGDHQRRVHFWYGLGGAANTGGHQLLMRGIAARLLGQDPSFALVAISPRPGEWEGDVGVWLETTGLADALADTLQSAP